MLDDLEAEMKASFLGEAQSLLEDAESALMALDGGDHSEELINRIFRLAHNLKSSAKTVGFQNLSDFAHIFEDALTLIKQGRITPNTAVCTVLLHTLDTFKSFIAGLQTNPDYAQDVSAVTTELKNLAEIAQTGFTPAPSTPDATPDALLAMVAEITGEAIDQAIAEEAQAAVAPAPVATATPVAPPKPADEENIKVGRKKLDALLNLMGELVVNQSIMADHRTQATLASDHSSQTLRYMEKLVHEIQDISMSLRMVPIQPLFSRLKRIARDASQELSKTIHFQVEGEHVEIDKTVLDRISDPLVHLVRNAVDHGLETDDERKSAGKEEPSAVTLKAQQQEDRILITLSDNGRGMNAAKLIAKAKASGLVGADEKISDHEAYSLIFRAGFSTKENVTEMSGRGVGMDVVQRAVDDLKGSIDVQTKLGEGTSFVISLPLSLSILTGMVIGVDQRKYVIPMTNLLETIELQKFNIESSTGKGRMINLRGEVIPVYSLSSILHPQSACAAISPSEHTPGVVTLQRGRKISFHIDKIFGQQQIVLKKLGAELQGLPGIVAGAILSNGEPGLVLNLNDFVNENGATHAA